MRKSIVPTYDRRETGDRFSVECRLNDRRLSLEPIPDPFHHTRVAVGWRDLLRGLLRRRLVVTVIVGGDRDIVEDVLELNDDYTGQRGSTRRLEWDATINRSLGDFAARLSEHDVEGGAMSGFPDLQSASELEGQLAPPNDDFSRLGPVTEER